MSDPFVGEIRMFAGNFAPRGWTFCDGQLLAVSQNDALFSLIGTIYGGDGQNTFGLPDLRGRIPVHAGTGPGLSLRRLGASFGTENQTLTANQLPSHNHILKASNSAGNSKSGSQFAAGTNARIYKNSDATLNLNSASVANAGGSQAHSNLMPTQCIYFIIALFGIYPSRS